MLDIRDEPVAARLETEFWPLLVDHREELTTNKALMQLAPDLERYASLEEAGMLFSLVAYDGEAIVGYSINFISAHIHYRNVIVASNDALFVAQSHRATLGLRLLSATRRAAKERGAEVMTWHAKPNTSLDRILRRKSLKVQDIIYTEEL